MKNEDQIHWILQEIAEERSPGNTINLWPQIKSHSVLGFQERHKKAFTENANRFPMKKSLLYTVGLLVLIATVAAASIPVVRAQVTDWVNGQTTLFSFLTPHSKVTVGLFSDGSLGFVPLSPTYLPPGNWATFPDFYKDESSGLETLKLTINKGDQFVVLTEWKAITGETLPVGEAKMVDNRPAVLVTGLVGEIDASIPLAVDGGIEPGPSGQVNLKPVQYTDGLRLIWQVGEIRLEILSNLSLRQVMRIATSLQAVESEPAQMTTTEP